MFGVDKKLRSKPCRVVFFCGDQEGLLWGGAGSGGVGQQEPTRRKRQECGEAHVKKVFISTTV